MEDISDVSNRKELEDKYLQEVLSSSLNDRHAPLPASRSKAYQKYLSLRNVTSHSVEELLHSCERKFQLSKLHAAKGLETEVDDESEGSVTFAFGHAVGAGVAEFDKSQDMNKAIMAAFLAWNIDLLESDLDQPRSGKKSFWHAVWALKVYETFYWEETDFSEYEIVKNEATLAVEFPDSYPGGLSHFYVGHIDEVMRHKETGSYRIGENKTTRYATVDPALYANSNQGLSYSLVMDAVGATEYEVVYKVYSSTEQRWLLLPFVKTSLAKAEWAQTQFLTISQLDSYSNLDFFPKRGRSCLSYGYRCKFFETCDWKIVRVFGKKFSELPYVTSFEELEEIEPLDYKFDINEILNSQLKKVQS